VASFVASSPYCLMAAISPHNRLRPHASCELRLTLSKNELSTKKKAL